ncbi:MAG: succinate dehydrogenase assembly factor 2 [Pseudomonadota bacterium]
MSETAEIRLKRIYMRSWRRGMKEMDLILGKFADDELATLSPEVLDAYERILDENDQDLYKWVNGSEPVPAEFAPMIKRIALFHGILGESAPN